MEHGDYIEIIAPPQLAAPQDKKIDVVFTNPSNLLPINSSWTQLFGSITITLTDFIAAGG
jgi:hypothetical protein